MEQKDFLLREIEKMGLILLAILNKCKGRNENLAITIENAFEQTNELLINQTEFDLKHFLSLDELACEDYISGFKGINTTNLELLADILFELGNVEKLSENVHYLKKTLMVYELCEKRDKTFSFDRKSKIEVLKNSI